MRSEKFKSGQEFPVMDRLGPVSRADVSGLWPGKALTAIKPAAPTYRAMSLHTNVDLKVQL
ncbi:hypothetical protein AB0M41_42990 [Streptomyces sp. NPDC051896]|uniref:hypothetical protein n=1 Tax=Streptomyces sp. NPDC051896 TaxID=3155416 RepID=UPI0034484BFE